MQIVPILENIKSRLTVGKILKLSTSGLAAAASVGLDYGRGGPHLNGRRCVGGCSKGASFGTTITGTISETSRVFSYAPHGFTDLVLSYSNYSGYNSDQPQRDDFTATQALTVKCSLEYPSGTIIPLFFENGARSIVIDPLARAFTHPVSVEIPAGTQYWIRTNYQTSSTSNTIPAYGATNTNSQGKVSGDSVDSGTIAASTAWVYGPEMILGTPDLVANPDPPSLMYISDSIGNGTGDSPANAGGETGFIWRAIGGQVPIMAFYRVTQNGHTIGDDSTQASRARRGGLWQACKWALIAVGVNDVFTYPQTLVAIQGRINALVAALKARGLKVIVQTIGPDTSSTDSWATLGNQTVRAQESIRTGYNDWLRTNALGSVGADKLFEYADVIESARNSGKWAVSGGVNAQGTSVTGIPTADGLHPASTMHILAGNSLATLLATLT